MNLKSIYYFLLLVLLSTVNQVFAQKAYTDSKRAAYIFYITDNVKWANDTAINEYKIGILSKDTALLHEVRLAAQQKGLCKKRKIQVLQFKSFSSLQPVQVLYVNHNSGFDIDTLLSFTKGQYTLVISENYDFGNSMIMLVEVDGERRFSINSELLEKEGLRVSSLFKASAVKTRQQWEEESRDAKSLLSQQNTRVKQQQEEIEQQKAEIEKQHLEIETQKKEIVVQLMKIKKQREELGKLSKETELQEQNLKIKLKELEKQELKINKQNQILDQQINRIKEQKQLISNQLEKIQTQKIMLYLFLLILVLVLIMVFFIYKSYQIKKEANLKLKEKNHFITLKNEEITKKNTEIEAQRNEIEQQRDCVITQRDQISHQKQEITDSIHYASRIQTAILPPQDYISTILPDYFILYKPRDIVSGDFYWIKEVDNQLVVVAADCTGHGVPGAFMSMLGISFLNEIIAQSEKLNACQILNQLRKLVITSLHQGEKDSQTKDGMDISLTIIDKTTMQLQFAGAYNPLYIVRKKENSLIESTSDLKVQEYNDYQLLELKADRMPIGIYIKMSEFSNEVIQLQKEDTLYMFSDGYADQFGGDEGGKLMSKNFKRFLADIQNQTMQEQKNSLDNKHNQWRGERPQVDDILVIGLKI